MSPNMRAFLDMLAVNLDTSTIRGSDDGYNVSADGSLFPSYADHPRQRVWFSLRAIWSTAAGRYRITARNFDAYKAALHLADFSPMSQDLIAQQQIREQFANEFVENGQLRMAVARCRNIWGGLPGSIYGPHEQHFAMLKAVYQQAGGSLFNGSAPDS